jgi:hypothetical protein
VGFSESGWAREVFIDVFSVADLCRQDHKDIIMNFVNNAVISRADSTSNGNWGSEIGGQDSAPILWVMGEE